MAKTTETTVQETKYKLSKLRENSKELYGVSKSTFDGATVGLDAEKEYSKAEVKSAIEIWLKKPITKKEGNRSWQEEHLTH